jgi:glycolate oxidase FAD binding subunit
MQQLLRELRVQARMEVHVGFTAQPLWTALVEWVGITQAHTVFKASLLPSAAAAFCQRVGQESPSPALCAHVGNGVVYGAWPADLTKEQAARMLTSWRGQVQTGRVIVTQCPAEWKSTLSVWGPAPSDAWLMHEIKAKFDPKKIFNPGRFVDGI